MAEQEEEWGDFVNPMDFPLNFRALWLPGNPAIQINPGQTINGPIRYLSNYRFLMPVRMRMHKVSSITVDQDGSYQDVGEDGDEVIKINDSDVVEVVSAGSKETKDEFVPPSQEIIDSLPLQLGDKRVWFNASMDDLHKSCEILKVEIPIDIMALGDKDRKWAIVRLIKKALGKEVK